MLTRDRGLVWFHHQPRTDAEGSRLGKTSFFNFFLAIASGTSHSRRFLISPTQSAIQVNWVHLMQ